MNSDLIVEKPKKLSRKELFDLLQDASYIVGDRAAGGRMITKQSAAILIMERIRIAQKAEAGIE